MSNRIQCKFFAHGACLKGECCEFAHDWKAPVNNVCTFYQKGACSYGSRCRYDHVKVSRPSKPVSSSSSSLPQIKSETDQLTHLGFSWNGEFKPVPTSLVQSSLIDQFDWPENSEYLTSDLPICSFAAAGNCPHGDNCPHIHGDLCSICGKHCLHPFRPDEREQHIKTCEKNSKRIEALKRSQDIECSVCLDLVLSKPTAAERKFGLLSECDHPFCISCIRNWRNNSPSSGMDVYSTLRSCPICRKQSHFVIPSVIWYSNKEEKQEIIDSYKQKLKSIDCKYFDFGNGTCPFGTSCFYKHAYRDGSLEEVILRHLNSEDGETVIAKNIRLSDFFDRLHIGSS